MLLDGTSLVSADVRGCVRTIICLLSVNHQAEVAIRPDRKAQPTHAPFFVSSRMSTLAATHAPHYRGVLTVRRLAAAVGPRNRTC